MRAWGLLGKAALRAPLRRSTSRGLTTNIFVVGKKNSVEGWINEGCAEFEKRLTPIMALNTVYLKSDEELVTQVGQARGVVILLDEGGREYTSREFSKLFYASLEKGGAHCSFVVGGFAGLPPELKASNKYLLLSLSKMTWTHQMARLLLIEQIYRATEIHKGSGYHKD